MSHGPARRPFYARQSAAGSFGNHDVIDTRIDVGAQKALIRLKGSPATSADAAGLLDAVKGGRLRGIFGDDLRAAAQLAARLGTVRWELVPRGQAAALVREPNPATPPTIIFRTQYRDDRNRLDPALVAIWRGSGLTRAGGAVPAPTRDRELVFHPLLGPAFLVGRRPAAGGAEAEVPDDLKRPCPNTNPGIVGPDGRQLVGPGSMVGAPYRFICSLLAVFKLRDAPGKEVSARATGTLISDRHVLTVGHALSVLKSVCRRNGKRVRLEKDVDRVLAVPGRFGAAMPDSAVSVRARVSTRWAQSEDPEFDFGLVTLSAPIGATPHAGLGGARLGFWGSPRSGTRVRAIPPDSLLGERVTTSGYPADKCFDKPSAGPASEKQLDECDPRLWASAQWEARGLITGPLLEAAPRRIFHNIDTVRGQSGSPIWRDSPDGFKDLVGIATAASTSGQNFGVRITQEVLGQLGRWMREDGVTPTF